MVKRYNPAQMTEAFNGGWVRGSDYDALADELDALRKAADGVLKAYMPQFPDSRAVDDCLVALASARSGGVEHG